jgi:O-antigen/teichoic acid export membrane protein
MVALPVTMITVALAEPLTLLLGGPQYLPHAAIALQLMIGSIPFGWVNSITNYVLIALGQQTKLTRAFVIGLTFNLVANLIFIPRTANGYEAAAVITIFSEIVEGAAFYYYLRRSLGSIPWLALFGPLILAAMAMAAMVALLLPVSLLLAVIGGLAVYGIGLIALGAFGPEERELLRALLPRRQEAQPEREPA